MPIPTDPIAHPEDENFAGMLEIAGLGHLLPAISARAHTLEALAALTPHDYAAAGVTSMVDRRKLFDLIQRIARRAAPQVRFADPPPSSNPPRAPPEIQRSPARNRSASVSDGARTSAPGAPRQRQSNRIAVAVRKRPLSAAEAHAGSGDIVEVTSGADLTLHEPKQRLDLSRYVDRHVLRFDAVLDERKTNADVHAATTAPLVDTVFEGGRATCFAYGQTGSGKTHTMLGKGGEAGLYVLAARDILSRLDASMAVCASFFEIYGGKLFDLLNEHEALACLEDAGGTANIVGLKEFAVTDTGELVRIVNYGNARRSSGQTGMNADSSRSHAVLHMNVYRSRRLLGRMTFVDLAGSERGADTINADRHTRMEGAEINKSLLSLKECIRALDQGRRYIPFRGTKLTTVLRDSFVGNCRTVMIGNVSPASASCEHTLNTLRYADRVRELSGGGRAAEAMTGRVPTERVISGRSTLAPPRGGFGARSSVKPASQDAAVRHTVGNPSESRSHPKREMERSKYKNYIYRCTAILQRQVTALDALEESGDFAGHAAVMRSMEEALAAERERVLSGEA